jgi:3'-phosphoadenosine 5'-phosphosulfate sulfotransferase (PAPS reductase)/FAD synthetase
MGKRIIAYSGGIASAYCISLVKDAEVYFNDTKWEHDDLYRFNKDVEKHYGINIVNDSDGRSPEQVFNDEHMLGNNRAPICSRVLKAQRLQRYAKPGDTIYFGIMPDELPRAARIRTIYTALGVNTEFPMLTNNTAKSDAFLYFERNHIKKPHLYNVGFEHNNCSGGCVRAGKKSWARLFHTDKVTYEKRSKVESDFNCKFKCHYSFIKGCTLEEFKEQIPKKQLYQFDDDGWQGECIGLCAIEKSADK